MKMKWPNVFTNKLSERSGGNENWLKQRSDSGCEVGKEKKKLTLYRRNIVAARVRRSTV